MTQKSSKTSGEPGNADSLEIQRSPEFAALRRSLRVFVFPATVVFLLWYALYVVLSAYARDFMGVKVVGEINVALIFGLLQFVSTFLIAWLYSRYAAKNLDPKAEAIKEHMENRSPHSGAGNGSEDEA
ncbi:MAG TPA: DUF485 domain-containing protein [Phytomonospora sp.]